MDFQPLFRLVCLISIYLNLSINLYAQTLTEKATTSIEEYKLLIEEAQLQGIDVLRDRLTIRTAEVFLEFAAYDQDNVSKNEIDFSIVQPYKDNASEMANLLPDWERQNVINMLESGIKELQAVIKGEVVRKTTPNVDWHQAFLDGDQITYQGRPVFLADWTWKPSIDKLKEFHGQQDGYFLPLSVVNNKSGKITPWVLNNLSSKPDGSLGFVFFNHRSVPDWAKLEYGDQFEIRNSARYTEYDIDHPGAREMMGFLIDGTVPDMIGKKYRELGYMLCNEPHFYTTKTGSKLDWASSIVSTFTIDKFKNWLSTQHETIADLNLLWGTSFSSFDDVTIEIPIDRSNIGKPMWYDWVLFNQYRVTNWYQFIKDRILSHDPEGLVHLKVMPNLWTENTRGHGIDMEALTRMSGIIGNDAGALYNHMFKTEEWMDHYAFDWREMSMGHDFYKSISPQKIMYNTEAHYLSTVRSRDLYQNPKYSRATYWLAHTQGMTASQTWYWSRREDGSPRNDKDKGYAGSNNQQPWVTNEVHKTIMDLNSFSEEIMAYQRQRKPIRIYYTKASAINKAKHMDDLFELYEDLFFEGIPLGFATQGILENENQADWDVILVYKTEYATRADIEVLQKYIDKGGKVILDGESLKKDEYGRSRSNSIIGASNVNGRDAVKSSALQIVEEKGLTPKVLLKETNSIGVSGCTWKIIENGQGKYVVSIVNLGKTEAEIDLTIKDAINGTQIINMLDGTSIPKTFSMKPYDVKFLEVQDASNTTTAVETKKTQKISISPNPVTGDWVEIKLPAIRKKIEIEMIDLLGKVVFRHEDKLKEVIILNKSRFQNGMYAIRVRTETEQESHIIRID
ncbi:T9SS type A sorting domain-containing protein [Reichenbachiella versicolor]|uniref:T9SS type A sorting domain-containing protein n=1 Tax=Reichenbachiella versicolor TaxID=1821036 RepID=UPI000D6E7D91|nr:T9SS type A sorting domain-containing protein [Reichenbachiella versicolor]